MEMVMLNNLFTSSNIIKDNKSSLCLKKETQIKQNAEMSHSNYIKQNKNRKNAKTKLFSFSESDPSSERITFTRARIGSIFCKSSKDIKNYIHETSILSKRVDICYYLKQIENNNNPILLDPLSNKKKLINPLLEEVKSAFQLDLKKSKHQGEEIIQRLNDKINDLTLPNQIKNKVK